MNQEAENAAFDEFRDYMQASIGPNYTVVLGRYAHHRAPPTLTSDAVRLPKVEIEFTTCIRCGSIIFDLQTHVDWHTMVEYR